MYLRKILIIFCKIRQVFLNAEFEGLNRIALSTKIKNCKVGLGTYISSNSQFINTNIGRFCCIGQRVFTIVGTHPINQVSMHPAFYSTDLQAGFTFVKEKKYNDILSDIKIGNDVWIGSDVKILGGIKIGDGVVVAAGAVVTKDIPPYEIWGGVPAQKIKDRFNEKEKFFLIELKWWNKDLKWIKENHEKFYSIEILKKRGL